MNSRTYDQRPPLSLSFFKRKKKVMTAMSSYANSDALSHTHAHIGCGKREGDKKGGDEHEKQENKKQEGNLCLAHSE